MMTQRTPTDGIVTARTMLTGILKFYCALTVIAAFAATSDARDNLQDVPDACKLPPKRGKHAGRFDFWYFDTNTHHCKWMAARSIYGNANRFVSRAACLAYCKHHISDPCQAVTCGDEATCRSVKRTKCELDVKTNETIACPPNFAVCHSATDDPAIRYSPIPDKEVYQWVMPTRCNVELRNNTMRSSSTESTPRMLVQYRAVDRKCKGFYVYPPAVAYRNGLSPEDAIRSLIEDKNAFFDLEQCMSTCAD